ncbi:hypothetical protein EAI_10748 [Harpegnathos saltator]|uniref:Uncharacterized protein n=1 Tax=Harpegnathos saltator TaxID=610380 RepID=E2BIR2_HARSA|nr:hypothetical protein EAI_10748 [Harpegnathos saltator]
METLPAEEVEPVVNVNETGPSEASSHWDESWSRPTTQSQTSPDSNLDHTMTGPSTSRQRTDWTDSQPITLSSDLDRPISITSGSSTEAYPTQTITIHTQAPQSPANDICPICPITSQTYQNSRNYDRKQRGSQRGPQRRQNPARKIQRGPQTRQNSTRRDNQPQELEDWEKEMIKGRIRPEVSETTPEQDQRLAEEAAKIEIVENEPTNIEGCMSTNSSSTDSINKKIDWFDIVCQEEQRQIFSRITPQQLRCHIRFYTPTFFDKTGDDPFWIDEAAHALTGQLTEGYDEYLEWYRNKGPAAHPDAMFDDRLKFDQREPIYSINDKSSSESDIKQNNQSPVETTTDWAKERVDWSSSADRHKDKYSDSQSSTGTSYESIPYDLRCKIKSEKESQSQTSRERITDVMDASTQTDSILSDKKDEYEPSSEPDLFYSPPREIVDDDETCEDCEVLCYHFENAWFKHTTDNRLIEGLHQPIDNINRYLREEGYDPIFKYSSQALTVKGKVVSCDYKRNYYALMFAIVQHIIQYGNLRVREYYFPRTWSLPERSKDNYLVNLRENNNELYDWYNHLTQGLPKPVSRHGQVNAVEEPQEPRSPVSPEIIDRKFLRHWPLEGEVQSPTHSNTSTLRLASQEQVDQNTTAIGLLIKNFKFLQGQVAQLTKIALEQDLPSGITDPLRQLARPSFESTESQSRFLIPGEREKSDYRFHRDQGQRLDHFDNQPTKSRNSDNNYEHAHNRSSQRSNGRTTTEYIRDKKGTY